MKPQASEMAVTSEARIIDLADHLFRQESGRLISILTGIFGLRRLQMAEDVVQEALVRALATWPFHGIPENPSAWLMRTARNLALDLIRRESLFFQKQPEIATYLQQRMPDQIGDEPVFEDEMADDRLRLMFACCHPVLPQDAQTALALKTLCGFGPGEIARAFLTTETAIIKRLTRARQRLQSEGVPFEIPAGAELHARLDGVLRILYLLFNEGYKASNGEELVRSSLCGEAIELTKLLVSHPAGAQPRVEALLALMLLNAARLGERSDSAGNLVCLDAQDRSRWNEAMIRRGIFHLGRSATGGEVTEYHLQAAIVACHATALDEASTDWPRILHFYDQLLELDPSPVVALNRAIAESKVAGPAAAIRTIRSIPGAYQLQSYHLYHAVMGDMELRGGDAHQAADHFREALQLTSLKPERNFLTRRIRECETTTGLMFAKKSPRLTAKDCANQDDRVRCP